MKKHSRLQAYVEARWYGAPGLLKLLTPLEWMFAKASRRRKLRQQNHAYNTDVPVVVVGNISVGGTGKTPTLIAMINFLQRKGKKPGVVSRGYGRASRELHFLTVDSVAEDVGDEPLLIFRSTQCAVAVGANRIECIDLLVAKGCDVIVADDGLQHYEMGRAKEIIVVDGQRLFGNEHLLPVGPLREGISRLDEADWVLVNQSDQGANLPDICTSTPVYGIAIKPVGLTRIVSGERYSLDYLSGLKTLNAFAGLGNPHKFFYTLKSLGVDFLPHAFPDHYQYSANDFLSLGDQYIIMTEKDAVKCQSLVGQNAFCLNVEMQLPDLFLSELNESITKDKINDD